MALMIIIRKARDQCRGKLLQPQVQQRSLSWVVRQKTWLGAESCIIVEEDKDSLGSFTASDSKGCNHHRLVSFSPKLWSPPGDLSNSIRRQFSATFLPVGYPSTSCVAQGYLQYVGWQAAHHAAGAANGVLASTFLLYAVGLGHSSAIPTAGALSWVLKDGLGQLGTLLFGRAMAHNFDVASRSWYVAASVKLNAAMALEISTFAFPQYFVALGALANAIKGLAWMAGGSSRSAFNVAFAIDRNIADITAKATSQTICTSLAGTMIGMGIASMVGQSIPSAVACFSGFAAIHIWTAVKSAQIVPLATLNPSRLTVLAEIFLKQHNVVESSANGSSTSGGSTSTLTLLPSPPNLARMDSILSTKWLISFNQPLNGVVSFCQRHSLHLADYLSLYRHKRHILFHSNKRMHVILHEDASVRDSIIAVLQAVVWHHYGEILSASEVGVTINPPNPQFDCAKRSLIQADAMFEEFVKALKEAGWDADGIVLEGKRHHRAVW